jgi:hypothetical protein
MTRNKSKGSSESPAKHFLVGTTPKNETPTKPITKVPSTHSTPSTASPVQTAPKQPIHTESHPVETHQQTNTINRDDEVEELVKNLSLQPGAKLVEITWPHTFDIGCHVHISGSFTDWKKIPLKRNIQSEMPHVFRISLPLPPGSYPFVFFVNGVRKHDAKQPSGFTPDGEMCNKVNVK